MMRFSSLKIRTVWEDKTEAERITELHKGNLHKGRAEL